MDKKNGTKIQAPKAPSWQRLTSILPGKKHNIIQAQCCKPGPCSPK